MHPNVREGRIHGPLPLYYMVKLTIYVLAALRRYLRAGTTCVLTTNLTLIFMLEDTTIISQQSRTCESVQETIDSKTSDWQAFEATQVTACEALITYKVAIFKRIKTVNLTVTICIMWEVVHYQTCPAILKSECAIIDLDGS